MNSKTTGVSPAWQNWAVWEDFWEAKESLEFHACGREYEIMHMDMKDEYGACSVQSCDRAGRYRIGCLDLCAAHIDELYTLIPAHHIRDACTQFSAKWELRPKNSAD